jgi:hypothetical protein
MNTAANDTLPYVVVNGDTIYLDGTFAPAYIRTFEEPKQLTAFDTIQPCDIKLLEVGDTARSASFVGTIKPNVCAGYSPSADDISITCTDSIMWAFTTYALLKLCFKVAFWPRG